MVISTRSVSEGSSPILALPHLSSGRFEQTCFMLQDVYARLAFRVLLPSLTRRVGICLLALATCLFVATTTQAQLPSLEAPAAKLQAATVTVRITPQADVAADRKVTVCSGVVVGNRLVATQIAVSSRQRIRVTLTGGGQAEAKVRVVDYVSSLVLLELDEDTPAQVAPAEELPKVGSWVLSAAGWGAEPAVVSFGIVSGVDRALGGTELPPLVQCDLRTADTSTGAGLVNVKGELVGMVIATGAAAGPDRWTFCVPVRHVQRMLRAKAADKVVFLRRRRPTVGVDLVAGKEQDTVVVGRVTEGGPAAKAGLRPGDQVLAADGIKIRSVYNVVMPLLKKQPGDAMKFQIKRGEQEQTIDVVLGGGIAMNKMPDLTAEPKIAQRRIQIGPLNFQRTDADPPEPEVQPAANDARLRLLERALDGYINAIARLRENLDQQEVKDAESQEMIRKLQKRVEELQEQMRGGETGNNK